jgi:hypothetical protein
VVKLGGFVGALLAVGILFVFTEWLFVDTFASDLGDALEVVITVAVAAVGGLVGSQAVKRLASRRA